VAKLDPKRAYLIPHLIILNSLCSDAKNSFSIITNSISELSKPHVKPSDNIPNFRSQDRKDDQREKLSKSYSRVGILSFVSICAIISNMVWPAGANKEPTKTMNKTRKRYLKKFFPKKCFSTINNRDFRNFLSHVDERLDLWGSTTSTKGGIAINTIGLSKQNIGKTTMWNNLDPNTLIMTYIGLKNRSRRVDLKKLNLEDIKLRTRIPKALVDIYNAKNLHLFDYLLDD
jgi:hypothetical protein